MEQELDILDQEKPQTFYYRIDAEDRLTSLDAKCTAFARENQTKDMDEKAMLGESLFAYFAGKETQHVYAMILQKVRRTGKAVKIPFRCDAPGLRRFMELTISLSDNASIEFSSRIVRTESRPDVPLLDPTKTRSNDHLVICSWCKRVELDGTWCEVEEAVEQLNLFHAAELPELTHGICDRCNAGLVSEIEESKTE